MTFEEFCEVGIIWGEMRYYKYKEQGFSTPSGKFELYSNTAADMGLSPFPVYREPKLSPVASPKVTEKYPFILTTGGRLKAFFSSEYRQIPSLRKIMPEPLVEINPYTAIKLGVKDGDWVWIESPNGRIRMKAKCFDGIAPDVVQAPHGWWFPEQGPPDYGWKQSNINILFGDEAVYDPETGSEGIRCSLCNVYLCDGTISANH